MQMHGRWQRTLCEILCEPYDSPHVLGLAQPDEILQRLPAPLLLIEGQPLRLGLPSRPAFPQLNLRMKARIMRALWTSIIRLAVRLSKPQ